MYGSNLYTALFLPPLPLFTLYFSLFTTSMKFRKDNTLYVKPMHSNKMRKRKIFIYVFFHFIYVFILKMQDFQVGAINHKLVKRTEVRFHS